MCGHGLLGILPREGATMINTVLLVMMALIVVILYMIDRELRNQRKAIDLLWDTMKRAGL
jgi:preprotein translocase subunit YajC